MIWAAVVGASASVAGTIISIFQFDSAESTRREIVAAGLLIGVPVAMAGGAAAGWIWGLLFKSDGGSDQQTATGGPGAAGEGSAPRDQVGHWQGDPHRRKRR